MEGLSRPLQDHDVWTRPQQGTSQNVHQAGEKSSCKMVASFPNSVGFAILGHNKGLGCKLTHLSLGFFTAKCLPVLSFWGRRCMNCRHVLTIHLHSAEKDHSCHRCWGISWAYLKLNPRPRLPSSLALWNRPDLAEIMKQLLHLAVLHVATAFPWQPGIFGK